MNRWVTADTHFHHANIIKYCARPFRDVDEMDETMVALWNERVAPDDEVYLLGDFYWIKGDNRFEAQQLLKKLHGKVSLVKGDHDPGLPQMAQFGFASLSLWKIVDDILLIHNYETRWTHKELAKRPPFKLAFSGHVHRHWLHSNIGRAKGVALNVGVDLWHFRPVPWEVAVETQTEWMEYCKANGDKDVA